METYQLLETRLAQWIGTLPDNMVACASGTAALHLAIEAMELPFNSHVIVPDFTMIACARAVTMSGLKPLFCDVDDDRLLLDPDNIDDLCSSNDNVSAIMPVHVYGRQCYMSAIHDIAKKYDLVVIEDMAEIHGINPHPDTDAACWSFYRNKIVHGEEGGAVVYKDSGEAEMARCLRSLGFTSKHDFFHIARGHNYRMSNVHAELIIHSLSCYQTEYEARREIETIYDNICPNQWRMPQRSAPWVYDIRLRDQPENVRNLAVQRLREMKIEARYGFRSMSLQPEYINTDVYVKEFLPKVSGQASGEMLYLPLTKDMTRDKISQTFEVIDEVVRDG